MLYSLSGTVAYLYDDFFVLETAGIGFRVYGTHAVHAMAKKGGKITVFCHLQMEQGTVYGFSSHEELSLFETLITVSGVGPKMALKLLNNVPAAQLAALILLEKREDLSKFSGISQKTASKIIIELKEKLRKSSFSESGAADLSMQAGKSFELEELLRMLGYARNDIEAVCAEIDTRSGKIEEHIKTALRKLSAHKVKQA